MPLSDAQIRGIPTPDRGQKDYVDQHGLSLRVSQGGRKSWVFRHGAAGSRITLGPYPAISLSAARQRARELAAQITLGQHRPKSLTFETALDLYIEHHLKAKNRANTAKESERLLRRALPKFGRQALSEITTSEIAAFLDRMRFTPSEATHLFVAMKTFFNICIDRGYIETSPIGRLKKPHKAKPRSRVLTPTELRSVLITAQAKDTTYTRLLRLLIYSGQRLSQIRKLTPAHVDRDARTFTWSAEEMKGDEPMVLPYHDLTAGLLDTLPATGWFFPGEEDSTKPYSNFSNDHRSFLEAAGVASFRRHDLRRVYATYHAREIGTPPYVVDRILAHKIGGTEGDSAISRIYNVYRYQREFREAAECWENFLATLVTS
jgi:integrase